MICYYMFGYSNALSHACYELRPAGAAHLAMQAVQHILQCTSRRIPAILKAADVCNFGPQPDWAVFSESFPVGCAFHCNITYSQFFSVNPDRRRWLYNTSTGMYQQGCGLSAVQMSWTASEYLHQILSVNKTFLPPTAQVIPDCYVPILLAFAIADASVIAAL